MCMMSLMPDVHDRGMSDRSEVDWRYAERVNALRVDGMHEGRPTRKYFPPLEFVSVPSGRDVDVSGAYLEHVSSGLAYPTQGGVVPSSGGGNQRHLSVSGPLKYYKEPRLEKEVLEVPPDHFRGLSSRPQIEGQRKPYTY